MVKMTVYQVTQLVFLMSFIVFGVLDVIYGKPYFYIPYICLAGVNVIVTLIIYKRDRDQEIKQEELERTGQADQNETLLPV